MLIRQLVAQTGVPAQTIRYYESIGVLPRPKRGSNNYRQYTATDVECLRLIAGARSLGFSLEEISEILAARDHGVAPCDRILETMVKRLDEIDRRIADLLALRNSLTQLHREGKILPRDDVKGDGCICSLLKNYRESGQVTIQEEELLNT